MKLKPETKRWVVVIEDRSPLEDHFLRADEIRHYIRLMVTGLRIVAVGPVATQKRKTKR